MVSAWLFKAFFYFPHGFGIDIFSGSAFMPPVICGRDNIADFAKACFANANFARVKFASANAGKANCAEAKLSKGRIAKDKFVKTTVALANLLNLDSLKQTLLKPK